MTPVEIEVEVGVGELVIDAAVTVVDNLLDVTVDVTETTIDAAVGVAGVPGPQGPQGEQGPPGPLSPGYVHDQLTPATVWGPITHGLNAYPTFIIVDSAGTVIDGGEPEYLDQDTMRIAFGVPFAGRAFLR